MSGDDEGRLGEKVPTVGGYRRRSEWKAVTLLISGRKGRGSGGEARDASRAGPRGGEWYGAQLGYFMLHASCFASLPPLFLVLSLISFFIVVGSSDGSVSLVFSRVVAGACARLKLRFPPGKHRDASEYRCEKRQT